MIYYIVGAGGHARSCIAALKSRESEVPIVGIYDIGVDKTDGNEQILGIPIIGGRKQIKKEHRLILAVGDNDQRTELFKEYGEYCGTVIHQSVIIEPEVTYGKGNQILGMVLINVLSTIGDNNIINTKSLIEHECQIGNNNHISVGSVLCGKVKIGNNCFIGAGSTIKDRVSITDNVTIGAGSTVINDITEAGVYVGCPVRMIS